MPTFEVLAGKFLTSGQSDRRRMLNELETLDMSENEIICHLLKITNSVRPVFIPGS